jgi:hypothetical protein
MKTSSYSPAMWERFRAFARSNMLPITSVLRKLNEGDLYLLEQLQDVYFPIA